MVRLLPNHRLRANHHDTDFQSHNGAIAAGKCCRAEWCIQRLSIPQWCDCCLRERHDLNLFTYFQSHNGAIAALPPPVQPPQPIDLSIPQWCDCCSRWLNIRSVSCSFQSHNGAIAAVTSINELVENFSSFNPTMVRLLPRQNFGV